MATSDKSAGDSAQAPGSAAPTGPSGMLPLGMSAPDFLEHFIGWSPASMASHLVLLVDGFRELHSQVATLASAGISATDPDDAREAHDLFRIIEKLTQSTADLHAASFLAESLKAHSRIVEAP